MRSYAANVARLAGDRALKRGVLLYQGQMDWKDGATSNEAWIRAHAIVPNWVNLSRSVLRTAEDRVPYGWIKASPVGPFFDVVLSSAGHLVPMNQPKPALDMLSRFVAGTLATL